MKNFNTATSRKGVWEPSFIKHIKVEPKHKTLKGSDVFFKNIIDSMQEFCVFTTDKSGIIKSWNIGAEKLLGYQEKDVIGKNAEIIFIQKDRKQQVLQKNLQTAKHKGSFFGERWLLTKSKTKFWGREFITSLKNQNQKLIGFTNVVIDLTVTRQKEIILLESEDFNKSLFNSSPDCTIVLDLEANFLKINEPGKRIMQIDNFSELESKCLFDLWDPEYHSEIKKAISIAKRGRVGRFQGLGHTIKGIPNWWEVKITGITSATGKPKQLLCVYIDISEQKGKDEERKNLIWELEIERFKLINIFEKAPTFLAIVSGKNHVFEMANQAYYQIIGQRNIIGKPVIKAIPEVKGQGIIELLDKVFSTGRTFVGKETKLLLKTNPDGPLEEKYVNFVYQPSRDEMGKITGVLGHGYDVTEQVFARKKIEEAGELFHTLADNIPNLAWMAEPDGNIFWYNNRWYEYTGCSKEDMEGSGWQSVHDPAVLPTVIERWEDSIKSGEPFEMVFPLKGADNIFRPFLTRVIPIRDSDGNILRWFGTNTDITKQKELERMKDDFLDITSHELKTPLTVIKAYTQILAESFKSTGNASAGMWVTKMELQVNKLTGLIEDLLDVTKIRGGKMQFNYVYFEFNELLKQIVDEVQRTAPNHEIEIYLEKEKKIYCDRERLGQVITNFLTNAIKYSPKTNKIIVKTKVDKDNITLSVKDFGLGISKLNHKKIFEQFFRVSESEQHTFPGIGLGLYISSQIIKRMGGKIWVESKKDSGSVFYFTVPVTLHITPTAAASDIF